MKLLKITSKLRSGDFLGPFSQFLFINDRQIKLIKWQLAQAFGGEVNEVKQSFFWSGHNKGLMWFKTPIKLRGKMRVVVGAVVVNSFLALGGGGGDGVRELRPDAVVIEG